MALMSLTSREEDYLEAIYLLTEKGDRVGITDVARELGVTLPTVKSAVSRLKQDGLVEQKHYGKIVLNPTGQKIGAEIYRAHRALRVFLNKILQVPLDVSESEACRMEHAISKDTLKRLESFVEDFQSQDNR